MSTWEKIIFNIKKNSDKTNNPDFLFHSIRYWDPNDRPLYYFKTYLYNAYNNLDSSTKKIFLKNYHTIYKKKYSLYLSNHFIDFDFIQSSYEYEFLKKELKKCKNILEIGAGYGRTCCFILKYFKNINNYTIIDFREVYNKYAKKYLNKNLKKSELKKISFFSPNNYKFSDNNKFDLAINIDSLQEMDLTNINKYLDLISLNAKMFYSCNALIKYRPEDFGIKKNKIINHSKALQSGKNKIVANVFNDKEFNKKIINKGLNNYIPKDFKIKYYSINKLIPFYADCIYIRKY